MGVPAKTILLSCLLAGTCPAQAYHLFDPRPDSQMRELSTDRPDTTESPYTVDAGHYQAELELISWGQDDDGTTETTTTTGSANLKAGLSDNVDIQLVIEPKARIKETSAGSSLTMSGRGDTQIRLKYNLWGNDGGDTAAAIMPFVEFDTHSKRIAPAGKTEGGVIIPIGFSLPGGWSSAAMIEFDFVRNAANDGYSTDLLQSITFAHDITDNSGGFIELVNITPRERGSEGESYFNGGLTFAVGKDMQLDTGFNAGLNEASEDLRLFLGLSIRK